MRAGVCARARVRPAGSVYGGSLLAGSSGSGRPGGCAWSCKPLSYIVCMLIIFEISWPLYNDGPCWLDMHNEVNACKNCIE